ncbi:MAG: DUF4906 domain-containing protein, partial [Alistipes sp.]|nr:DUF4906 domain-containing protein [Alistipes sp.]
MNRFLLCISLLGISAGCDRGEFAPFAVKPQMVRAELPIVVADSAVITRLTDEDTIYDINFYLFGCDNGFSLHLYKDAVSPLRFECPAGNYTIYAIANMHEEMGYLTSGQLAACTLSHTESFADLPMTACREVSIQPVTEGILSLPALEVRRCVAKVAYRITVEPSDISLQSVQAFNLPCCAPLFGETSPADDASAYTSGVRMHTTSASNFTGRHYQLANPQGSVAAISDQRQKDFEHAPAHASYLLIQALRGARVLTYRVYLGENNTDNFDVRCNTYHQLDITIRGDNEFDTRVSSYTVRVWDDAEDERFGGYCVQDSRRSLHIQIQSHRNYLPLHAEIAVSEGAGSDLMLHGTTVNDRLLFDLFQTNGTNSYELNYCPEVFDSTNSVLSYTVAVWDEGGFRQTFSIRHNYANMLYAYIHDGSENMGGRGTIEVRG